MVDSRYLIVGLGNPGRKYELTRHNAGFLALDYFADQQNFTLGQMKWQAEFCRVRYDNLSLFLVKPQTFMNKSGEAVARFADFYKILPERILILHDDLGMQAGKIKVVTRGGAGGHNGIRSIISHLKTSNFARLKIGIGRPSQNEKGQGIPVDRYVLSSFNDSELSVLNKKLPLVDEAVKFFVTQGPAVCMNRVNGQ